MSVQVHPEYSYPVDDIKINEHWEKSFNINGRLSGFNFETVGSSIVLSAGAFISNGVVIEVDQSVPPTSSILVQPYYIYGYFGGSDTGNLPTIGASRTLENGYAPLILMHDDTHTMLGPVALPGVASDTSAHISDSSLHITQDEYSAIVGSNSPSLSNVFAKLSDTTSQLSMMTDELKLLPFSLAAGYAVDDVIPKDQTTNTVFDSVTSNSVEFIDIGIKETFDTTSASCQRSDEGYMDAILSNIAINANDTSILSLSRCEVSSQTEVPGLKSSSSYKMNITNAQGPARMTWFSRDETTGGGALDLGFASDYVYTNISIPDSTDLFYIEMSASDGTTIVFNRIEAHQLSLTTPNTVYVNTSGLIQSSILYIDIKFQYRNATESGFFYMDSISKASHIDTIGLTDTPSAITFARVTPLVAYGELLDYPIIDISIDDGTTYLCNIIPDHYINLESLPTPTANYKLKLRFNLINNGGDYSVTKTQWPDNRHKQAMICDTQADISVLIGGDEGFTHKASSIIYNRLSDAISTGPTSTQLELSESAHTTIGERIALVGGRKNNIPQLNNTLLNWGNNTVIENQALTINSSSGGLAADGINKLLNLNGKGNLGIDSFLEFNIPGDIWSTLPSGGFSGKTLVKGIDNILYASYGEYGSSTGKKYNLSNRTWSSMSLEKFVYYSTCSLLKSRAIIYQSDDGVNQLKTYFDHETQIEKTTKSPTTGAGYSGSSVYYDDTVSFGPWEQDGTYNKTHYLYVPYKSSRLSGFAVKYITE